MNSDLIKVLLIDRDAERRKERISILQKHGYKVFPALDMGQAKERCKPGAYELIVVNSAEHPELAMEFCDSIITADPKQAVLLMVAENVQLPRRDYMVPCISERLLERINSMFHRTDAAVEAA